MSEVIGIIKRNGARNSELFRRDKLHASIVAACLSVRTPEGDAETTATNVCNAVIAWLSDKTEVTSHDLRRMATQYLQSFHPDAAYLYQHHRLVL